MGAVKMADRMGEIGEPCGVPWLTEKGAELVLLKSKWRRRSMRKERSHCPRDGSKPNSWKR